MHFRTKVLFGGALSALLLVVTPVWAQEDTTADEQEILQIIEAVRVGWLQADGTPFRQNFLDFQGARYVESGGQNVGLADLIGHHVEPEAGNFDEFELNFSQVDINVEGGFAWAIVDTEILITLKDDGKKIHNKGYETFVFKDVDSEWKVIHTHSSSRAVKK